MNPFFVLLAACSLFFSSAPTSAAEPPQPPIIDLHMHAWSWMEPAELLKRMDSFNVLRAGGG